MVNNPFVFTDRDQILVATFTVSTLDSYSSTNGHEVTYPILVLRIVFAFGVIPTLTDSRFLYKTIPDTVILCIACGIP